MGLKMAPKKNWWNFSKPFHSQFIFWDERVLFIHPNGGWPWDFWSATKFSPSEVAPCIYGGFQLGIHNGSRWCGSRSGKRFLGERPESRIVWKMSRQVDIWQYWYFHLGKKMRILGMDFCFSKTKSLDLFLGDLFTLYHGKSLLNQHLGEYVFHFPNTLSKSKKILSIYLMKASPFWVPGIGLVYLGGCQIIHWQQKMSSDQSGPCLFAVVI